jgi:hypothetical protein
MYKSLLTIITILLCLNLISCAEISPPRPVDVLRNPLGTDNLQKGMSKEEIVQIWGQPNAVNRLEKASAFSEAKEEWIYNARYPAVRVNANYLSKTRHLYFEGDTLIRWE